MIPLVDPQVQYQAIKPEIDEAIAKVLASGQFILGKEVEAFEQEFASYLGVKHAIGVASGTDALYLSLRACDIGEGDKVITTPFTFVSTAEAILRCGAIPLFTDINETGNIDLDKIDNHTLKSAKAILPVHLYGCPVDMPKLIELATKYKLIVIEDACQAIGAKFLNKLTGTFGEAGCFSFYPTKNIGSYGDAGIVTTDSPDIASKIRQLRNHGSYQGTVYSEHGINSRLDEIQASVLRVKLRHFGEWHNMRCLASCIYKAELRNCPDIVLPQTPEYCTHAWNYFTIQAEKRFKLRQFLANNNIATGVYYPTPLHMQPIFSSLGYPIGSFPMAEYLASRVISLPMFPELTERHIKYISRKVIEFYDRERRSARRKRKDTSS